MRRWSTTSMGRGRSRRSGSAGTETGGRSTSLSATSPRSHGHWIASGTWGVRSLLMPRPADVANEHPLGRVPPGVTPRRSGHGRSRTDRGADARAYPCHRGAPVRRGEPHRIAQREHPGSRCGRTDPVSRERGCHQARPRRWRRLGDKRRDRIPTTSFGSQADVRRRVRLVRVRGQGRSASPAPPCRAMPNGRVCLDAGQVSGGRRAAVWAVVASGRVSSNRLLAS